MTTQTRLTCGCTVSGSTHSKPAQCLIPEHRSWLHQDRPDHLQKAQAQS